MRIFDGLQKILEYNFDLHINHNINNIKNNISNLSPH
jgi:hypothetical protein